METSIKAYSEKLTKELGKGYTTTNLRYMHQFYLVFRKHHTLCDKLTWSHYRLIISQKSYWTSSKIYGLYR